MSELCWINGRIIPLADATVSIEDRGFQFADGVYEVIRFYSGKPFALPEHLDRLTRSCEGVDLKLPIARELLSDEITKYAKAAGLTDSSLYMQVTRGAAPRNHVYVKRDIKPTLLFYARPLAATPPTQDSPGVKLHSVRDERWRRCWIKAIALLPNVLAKNAAIQAGADEAVFVDDKGIVSECSTSNIFAVINGKLVTHPVGEKVLPGITRLFVLKCARDIGIGVEERPLRETEALGAEEVFISSTTREIAGVGTWNGKRVGSGRCGTVTKRLHEAFQAEVGSPYLAPGEHTGGDRTRPPCCQENADSSTHLRSPPVYHRGLSK
jgi:D-alanine transaminase